MCSSDLARGRAADLRREAHRVAVECRNAGIVDEIARLAASRSAAATDGSWTAAAAMTRQLEEARTRQKAEAAEEEERRRRNATVTEEQLIESLIRLPRATLARIVERLAGTAA